MKHAGLLLVAFALAGCFTIGRNFESASAPGWIKPGETTKARILDRLGDPFRVGVDAGDQTWSYGYYQYRLFGRNDNKDLVFRFDPAGKVKSYTLNTTYISEQDALDPSLKAAPRPAEAGASPVPSSTTPN